MRVCVCVSKHGKLKGINRAMIVKCCNITRDTLSNSLMVRKTRTWTAAIHITTFKNRASLLRGHKTVQNVRTNVRALHCDNLDRIQSRLNSVHVHYLEET